MLRDHRGFTLAELLAVIVVLAIILVLTMPAIMNTMESSKQSGFKMFAKRVAKNAAEQFTVDGLLEITDASGMCYTLEDLGLHELGSYKGKVVVDVNASLEATLYTITLSDRNYSITTDVKEIDEAEINDPITSEITCP